jgi:hypothetical protein
MTHKTIASALAAAQMQMGKALKQSNNPHFKSKYADLGSVMDACMPALNSVGIAVIQPAGEDEFGRYVETRLIHGESGEMLTCRVPLIVNKNDMQGYGSAVTYARRYGLMAMAGIAPEDDDGNAAAAAAPKKAEKPPVEDEMAWFKEHLPKMSSPDHLNSVMMRAKAAGREVAKLVADRANDLGFDFDPDQRCYVDLQAHKNAIAE